MTLAINLITRGRPERLRKTLETTLPNVSRADTIMVVSIDEDDDATKKVMESLRHPQLYLNVREREDTVGEKYNRVLQYRADVYANLSDYSPVTTHGFDQKILDGVALFPDGIGVVVNQPCNASFSNIYAVTKPLVDKLGFYFPEFFPFWFVDHWIEDIAKLIGRKAMVDVQIRPEPKPKTHGLWEPDWWGAFFDSAYMTRRKTAHAIVRGDDFLSPPWIKEMVMSIAPAIEIGSRFINQLVAQQARELEKWSGFKPDARYKRTKDAAVAMLPTFLADLPPHEAKLYRNALIPSAPTAQVVQMRAGSRSL